MSNVLLPDAAWLAFLVSWIMLIVAGRLSGFGYLYIFKRSFIALPFALAAVTAIFSIPGNALTTWHIGTTSLTMTDAGLRQVAKLTQLRQLDIGGTKVSASGLAALGTLQHLEKLDITATAAQAEPQ